MTEGAVMRPGDLDDPIIRRLLRFASAAVGRGAIALGTFGLRLRGFAASTRVATVLRCREFSFSFAVGELVEPLGEALGGAAGVDEDDRRVVLLDQPQQL